MANYPPNAPPPGGYGGPPPGGGGGYGGPPPGGGGGGYGGPPGGAPPGGYGPPPGGYGPPPGGYGGPPGGMPPGGMMMQPNAPFGIDPVSGMPYSDKSKMVAGLLNIFLFGVGRLYTGHIGLGIAQILTTLFCGVGYFWALIDGIMMLTGKVPDAQGRPLRD
jgi:TM2 domain